MSYKVYRGHSNESGTFDFDGAVCNIDTQMSMGTIDWSKSYVLFHHALNITNNPETIHNIVLQNNDAYLPSEAIVKRYRKSFDKAGVVCDVKDVNVYSTNIKQFSMDEKEKEVEFHPMLEKDNTGGSDYFTRKVTLGNTMSIYERYPLKVMLKDLDGFNKVATECDLTKFGNCRDFFELNKNVFKPVEVVRFGNKYWNGFVMEDYTNNTGEDQEFGTANVPIKIQKAGILPDMFYVGGLISVDANNNGGGIESHTGTILEVDDSEELYKIYLTQSLFTVTSGTEVEDISVAPKVFQDVTNNSGADMDVTQLVYTRKVDRSEIPFYVGEGLYYKGFNGNDPIPDNQDAMIQEISYDETTRLVTLTFNKSLGTVATGDAFRVLYTKDVTLNEYEPEPVLSTSIVEVELVLYSKKIASRGSQKIEYITVQSQRFNMHGSDHQDTFQLEPNCFNFMLMQPHDTALVSHRHNLTNYRMRLDGEDLTNRDVTVLRHNRQLHNDRLNMTFQNAGIPLKTLDSTNQTPSNYGLPKSLVYLFAKDIVYPLNPVPLTEGNKMLQVRLQGEDALGENAILFKQLSRTIQA